MWFPIWNTPNLNERISRSCLGSIGQIGVMLRRARYPVESSARSTAAEYDAIPLRAGGIGETNATRGEATGMSVVEPLSPISRGDVRRPPSRLGSLRGARDR